MEIKKYTAEEVQATAAYKHAYNTYLAECMLGTVFSHGGFGDSCIADGKGTYAFLATQTEPVCIVHTPPYSKSIAQVYSEAGEPLAANEG